MKTDAPTCETCTHWVAPEPALVGSDGSVVIEAESHGSCGAITFTRLNDDRSGAPAILEDYGRLCTLATFGCTLHEPTPLSGTIDR